MLPLLAMSNLLLFPTLLNNIHFEVAWIVKSCNSSLLSSSSSLQASLMLQQQLLPQLSNIALLLDLNVIAHKNDLN